MPCCGAGALQARRMTRRSCRRSTPHFAASVAGAGRQPLVRDVGTRPGDRQAPPCRARDGLRRCARLPQQQRAARNRVAGHHGVGRLLLRALAGRADSSRHSGLRCCMHTEIEIMQENDGQSRLTASRRAIPMPALSERHLHRSVHADVVAMFLPIGSLRRRQTSRADEAFSEPSDDSSGDRPSPRVRLSVTPMAQAQRVAPYQRMRTSMTAAGQCRRLITQRRASIIVFGPAFIRQP